MNSVKTELFRVNTQVRKMFAATGDGSGGGRSGGDGGVDPATSVTSCAPAEWHEGSIYHMNEDMATNPYKSIHVIWLQQEKSSKDWFYSYQQSDNLVSPWELQVSAFQPQSASAIKKQSSSRDAVHIPKSLLVGKLYSKAVLAYVKTDATTTRTVRAVAAAVVVALTEQALVSRCFSTI